MAAKKNGPVGTLPAWKWTGAEALEFVRSLNDRCLQALSESPFASSAGTASRARLLDLGPAARSRAAACPFLLLDLNWREVAQSSATDPPARFPWFPEQVARELAAEVLTLAWHTSRSDPHVAALVFGVSSEVVQAIRALGPQEVQRIASRQAHHLRLRWEDNAAFWEQLIRTAMDGRSDRLAEFHLHGLQLLGGDILEGMGTRPTTGASSVLL